MTLFADPEAFGLEHVGSLWSADQQRLQTFGIVVFRERASGRLLYARGESDQDVWTLTEAVGAGERPLEGFHTAEDLLELTPLVWGEFKALVEDSRRLSQTRPGFNTIDEMKTCERFLGIIYAELPPAPTSDALQAARRQLVGLRRTLERSPQARR